MTHPSNTSSGESDERAAFEAWARAYGRIFLERAPWETMAGEKYVNQWTQEAWVGWKARAALATQPAPAEAVKVCKFCEGTGNDPGGLPVCRECRGLGKITTPVAQPAESKACASVGVEPIAEALRPFAKLGGPWDSYCFKAFQDLEDDVVVYSNSGSGITAGDVRAARKALEGVALASPAPSVGEPVIGGHVNAEAEWIAQSEHLNCPACGGSGHVDDSAVRHICNLWVDPATRDYVVDRCDHPTSELIAAYSLATPPAAPAATEVPSGFQTVPVEPTEEMMNAGLYQSSKDSEWADVYSMWKDMLAVAAQTTDATQAPAAPSVVEPVWMTAFDDARDTILHGRDALEGALDNDQTNAVLSVLDDYFMPFLHRGATPPAAPAATEAPSKPFAYYIHIAAEQRGEFVHDLDEALDDLTNCDCKITELFNHATPAPAVGASTLYVEVRQCIECQQVDINGHSDKAACNRCDWSGPSPKEDHCPGCGADGTMTSACTECGARSDFLASADLLAAVGASKPAFTAEEIDKTVREVYIGQGPRGLMMFCKQLMEGAVEREAEAAVGASVQPVLASLSDALQRIVDWRLPRVMIDGRSCSYGTAYGSNGERDYMRHVAKDALAALASSTPTTPTKAE